MDNTLKHGALYNPTNLDRDNAFQEEPPAYLWCLHCERAYSRGEYRDVNGLQMCPYTECGGDTVLDAWNWSKIREGHPEYPEIPEEGVTYPMYRD